MFVAAGLKYVLLTAPLRAEHHPLFLGPARIECVLVHAGRTNRLHRHTRWGRHRRLRPRDRRHYAMTGVRS